MTSEPKPRDFVESEVADAKKTSRLLQLLHGKWRQTAWEPSSKTGAKDVNEHAVDGDGWPSLQKMHEIIKV